MPLSVPMSSVSPTARSTRTTPAGSPSSSLTRSHCAPSALRRLTPASCVPIQSRPDRSYASAVSAWLASAPGSRGMTSKTPAERTKRCSAASEDAHQTVSPRTSRSVYCSARW